MNKPVVKNFILIGIPTIISSLGIIMTQNNLSSYNDVFVFTTIALLIVFIVFIVYYARVEKKDNDAYTDLQKENDNLNSIIQDLMYKITSITNLLNTNSSIVASFVSIIEPWNNNINKIANDIKNRGKANEKDWDYEDICSNICIGCKDAIRQFTQTSNDTDISVGFIKYYTENNQDYVRMIAHSSPQPAKPDIFDIPELLGDCRYQYAKLIRDKSRTSIVYENNQKIVQYFYRRHDTTDLSKYTQYIAIPILCSKNKSLGVLQITTKYGCKIMESEVELRKFVETYITPFVELLTLVEKIQKGIFMKPKNNSSSTKQGI